MSIIKVGMDACIGQRILINVVSEILSLARHTMGWYDNMKLRFQLVLSFYWKNSACSVISETLLGK